jgi:hypothetical protein
MSINTNYNSRMKYNSGPLSPIFKALARLPLIGPHRDEEVALLQFGAKPVGMFGSFEPAIDILQDDVDAGRLIRCDVPRTVDEPVRIYGWPGADMEAAFSAQQLLMRRTNEPHHTALRQLTDETGFISHRMYNDFRSLGAWERKAIMLLHKLPDGLKDHFKLADNVARYVTQRNSRNLSTGSAPCSPSAKIWHRRLRMQHCAKNWMT